jgi:hypothetical protein
VAKRVPKTLKPTRAWRPREKALGYLALAQLNGALTQIVRSLSTLQDLKFLRRDVSSALRVALEETRCWANVEVIEVLLQREIEEWGEYGRRRRHWEKKLEDPDVLVEATHLKKSRSKK